MSTEVAVQGCTFKYETTPSGSVELVVTPPTATSKVAAKGKTAYHDKIMLVVVSGTVTLDSTPSGATPPASSNVGTVPPGTIIIDGTAQKATSLGKPLVLKGDNGSAVFNCIFPSETQPYETTYAVTIKATVDDPGQDVLKVT